MKGLSHILLGGLVAVWALAVPARAAEPVTVAGADSVGEASAPVAVETAPDAQAGAIDIDAMLAEHVGDTYSWHITTVKGHPVSIYLPVIVRSKESGWHAFSSRRLTDGATYEGFSIPEEGQYAGKVVAYDAAGTQYRPLDISITKNALALMINCVIMLAIFLGVARWYRRKPENAVPRGFVGAVEQFVMSIENDVIKQSIGKGYQRYSPYLLTVFFFILINNLMGLLPIFPGGASVTGNIAITGVLAICTMFTVNVFSNKGYWKDIFWPDVPWWLKVPIPLMQIIELFGVISKPFALMIRLLANMMAGHTVIFSLVCVIFISTAMGAGTTAGMTVFSVALTIFMNLLELLVAYIQAYVFTLLSAVFIGLAHPEESHAK